MQHVVLRNHPTLSIGTERLACLNNPMACSWRPSPSTRQVPGSSPLPRTCCVRFLSPPSLPSSFGRFQKGKEFSVNYLKWNYYCMDNVLKYNLPAKCYTILGCEYQDNWITFHCLELLSNWSQHKTNGEWQHLHDPFTTASCKHFTGKFFFFSEINTMKDLYSASNLPFFCILSRSQVRTLFVSGLPMDAKPRELYLLFRAYQVSDFISKI